MDNHPIPQDVTGFQFKLIGNMTVKQFAYLAAGAVLAVIAYYTPVTALWAVIIKYTLVPVFGLTGAAFAFLPYEGRPLDTIVSHFFMALFKPNQYIYQKKGGRLAFLRFSTQPVVVKPPVMVNGVLTPADQAPAHDPTREARLQALLSSLHAAGVNPVPLDEKEKHYMQDVFANKGQGAVAQPDPTIQPVKPTPVVTPQTTPPVTTPMPATPPAPPPTPPPASPIQQPTPTPQTPTPLSGDAAKQLGLPHLPDSPNLLIGIIKDSRDNVIPGILVEVKDKDGNPVRAFKTNQLGQFASATPLPNGNYTIEFEDPKGEHKLESSTLNADGTILQPFIIISADAREQLRRELFG